MWRISLILVLCFAFITSCEDCEGLEEFLEPGEPITGCEDGVYSLEYQIPQPVGLFASRIDSLSVDDENAIIDLFPHSVFDEEPLEINAIFGVETSYIPENDEYLYTTPVGASVNQYVKYNTIAKSFSTSQTEKKFRTPLYSDSKIYSLEIKQPAQQPGDQAWIEVYENSIVDMSEVASLGDLTFNAIFGLPDNALKYSSCADENFLYFWLFGEVIRYNKGTGDLTVHQFPEDTLFANIENTEEHGLVGIRITADDQQNRLYDLVSIDFNGGQVNSELIATLNDKIDASTQGYIIDFTKFSATYDSCSGLFIIVTNVSDSVRDSKVISINLSTLNIVTQFYERTINGIQSKRENF